MVGATGSTSAAGRLLVVRRGVLHPGDRRLRDHPGLRLGRRPRPGAGRDDPGRTGHLDDAGPRPARGHQHRGGRHHRRGPDRPGHRRRLGRQPAGPGRRGPPGRRRRCCSAPRSRPWPRSSSPSCAGRWRSPSWPSSSARRTCSPSSCPSSQWPDWLNQLSVFWAFGHPYLAWPSTAQVLILLRAGRRRQRRRGRDRRPDAEGPLNADLGEE